MIEESIAKEIDDSNEGSDIHGLLKKIAFQFHIEDKTASPETNWYKAQSTLYNWSEIDLSYNLGETQNLGSKIHKLLEIYAYSHYLERCKRKIEGKCDDDWDFALDELADQVLFQNFLYGCKDIHGFD